MAPFLFSPVQNNNLRTVWFSFPSQIKIHNMVYQWQSRQLSISQYGFLNCAKDFFGKCITTKLKFQSSIPIPITISFLYGMWYLQYTYIGQCIMYIPWSVAKQSIISIFSHSVCLSSSLTRQGRTRLRPTPIDTSLSFVRNKWCGDTSHVTWENNKHKMSAK